MNDFIQYADTCVHIVFKHPSRRKAMLFHKKGGQHCRNIVHIKAVPNNNVLQFFFSMKLGTI